MNKYIFAFICTFILFGPACFAEDTVMQQNGGSSAFDDDLSLEFNFNFDEDQQSFENHIQGSDFEIPRSGIEGEIDRGSGNLECISEDTILLFASLLAQEPLWCKTYYPRTRNPLYLVLQERMMLPHEGGFQWISFFNKSNKVTAPFLDTLALNLDLSSLQSAISSFAPAGLDINSLLHLLPFLKKFTTEERKSGAIIQLGFDLGRWTCTADTSIVLAERNIFAPQCIQDEILSTIERVFPGSTSTGIDTNREFARIRIGLGDTRVRLGFKAIDDEHMWLNIGANAIFPTSAKGMLLDGRFMAPDNTGSNGQFGFLICAPREILLVPRTGTERNFGLGVNAEAVVSLFSKTLDIRGRIGYDHYFPSDECRLFMFKTRMLPDQFGSDGSDPTSFKFQYVTPARFLARVYPGGVFFGVLGVDYTWGKWKFTAGYDFYLAQREELGVLRKTSVDTDALRINDGLQGYVQQQKGTLAVRYTTRADRSLVSIALGGDVSLASENMTDTWTVYAQIGLRF